jgi:hypothetical protein
MHVLFTIGGFPIPALPIHAERRQNIADGPGRKTGPVRYELRKSCSDISQRCALVKPAASAAASVVNHTSAMVRS